MKTAGQQYLYHRYWPCFLLIIQIPLSHQYTNSTPILHPSSRTLFTLFICADVNWLYERKKLFFFITEFNTHPYSKPYFWEEKNYIRKITVSITHLAVVGRHLNLCKGLSCLIVCMKKGTSWVTTREIHVNSKIPRFTFIFRKKTWFCSLNICSDFLLNCKKIIYSEIIHIS